MDCLQTSPIPDTVLIKVINSPFQNIFVTPDWGLWGGYNDRLWISSRTLGLTVLCRYDRIEEYVSLGHLLSPEAFLKYIVSGPGTNSSVHMAKQLTLRRVRSDGALRDCQYPGCDLCKRGRGKLLDCLTSCLNGTLLKSLAGLKTVGNHVRGV